MRRAAVIALAALAFALGGCASISYSDAGERHMVDIVNTGWYFLNFIPLASGDPDNPNGCSCKLFRQTTSLENNIKMLDRAIEERGAVDVRNVNSNWTDESILFILLKRHTFQTSAQLIIPTEEDLLCE
ncbi:MAG: hypothetical protein J6U17_00260 [Kiritimatiellae bacterium]|nr:hypothetical protein [Kiritimatiellia bacterium]